MQIEVCGYLEISVNSPRIHGVTLQKPINPSHINTNEVLKEEEY
jgi:hypothetical protein